MDKISCETEQLRFKLLERQNRKFKFNANDVPDCEEIKKKWAAIASTIDLK